MRTVAWGALLAGALGIGLPTLVTASPPGCCKIHCADDGRVSVMVIDATQLECEAYEPQCEVQWTAAQCEPPPGEPGFQMRIE
ncbi:MAG: hypothetical protein SF182_13555 [Deltaproteobacteria bacterium]|nr:hypothetical protein [Deltaproteobacteria bacterium]